MQYFLAFTLALNLLYCSNVQGQYYSAKNGTATFIVNAPAKEINGQSQAVRINWDLKKDMITLQVAVPSFKFGNNFQMDSMNAKLEARFNNYYMESEKFPVITYKAPLKNYSIANLNKDSIYHLVTEGILELHGVVRKTVATGIISVKSGKINFKGHIEIAPVWFGIRIPAYINEFYFKKITIEVEAELKKGKK